MHFTEIAQSRRNVVVGAGLGLLAATAAACSSSEKAPAAAGSDSANTTSAAGTSDGALAKTADVPVGSGVIVDDVVVTQPTAGVFSGFSTVCPHAGCKVTEVVEGKIICPCHGSKFNLDGTVAQGPAKSPLEAKAVSVRGNSIVAG